TGLSDIKVTALFATANGYIFAGTAGGGVYRSTDNGNNWTQQNSGITTNYITALAENGSGEIFAGTFGGGSFRSPDYGDSWISIGGPESCQIPLCYKIMDKWDIFVGSDFDDGIYLSSDNGDTWSHLPALGDSSNYSVYEILELGNGDILAATYGAGIFRSSDYGNTWNNASIGLFDNKVTTLAINSDNKIFAGTFLGNAVFSSEDNADNWTLANTGIDTVDARVLIFDDSSGGLFAGTYGAGIFLSQDQGDNWSQINTGLPAKFIHSMVKANGILFCGADFIDGAGGVFRS